MEKTFPLCKILLYFRLENTVPKLPMPGWVILKKQFQSPKPLDKLQKYKEILFFKMPFDLAA